MALQIGLPGQGGITKMTVGIDLGTTNSLIAIVKDNEPRVLKNPDGKALIPSVVGYTNDSVLVGDSAVEYALKNPENVIFSVKRMMGKDLHDKEIINISRGHKLVGENSSSLKISIGEKNLSPVEISSEILKALKKQAETVLKRRITQAVITVPAYFDDAQRQATKDAGKLAGLDVLRLLNEPTAAALAYGLDENREGYFAIYDLGGGTFDISILKLDSGVFEVLSTGGNTHLGGDDFDFAILQYILKLHNLSPGDISKTAFNELYQKTRLAKEALSENTSVNIDLSFLFENDKESKNIVLTRKEMEEIIAPFVEKTRVHCLSALRDANINSQLIDGVVLVGGATRTPLVRQIVEDIFQKPPYTGVDPDKVVAIGASIQAALLSGWKKDVLLLDVVPLSLGIETMGGIVEKLILRNSTIPASAKQVFTTFADGQTAMDIHVVQGERELVSDVRSLARFKLTGIPPLPAGIARVEVLFRVDADGILRVTAKEERTGIEQKIEVKPSYGLTDEDVEKMLKEALLNAKEDINERLLRDSRVEGDRILAALEKALAIDGNNILKQNEKDEIISSASDLKALLEGSSHKAIRDAIDKLDQVSADFARRRMSASIQHALAGKPVDSIEKELLT